LHAARHGNHSVTLYRLMNFAVGTSLRGFMASGSYGFRENACSVNDIKDGGTKKRNTFPTLFMIYTDDLPTTDKAKVVFYSSTIQRLSLETTTQTSQDTNPKNKYTWQWTDLTNGVSKLTRIKPLQYFVVENMYQKDHLS